MTASVFTFILHFPRKRCPYNMHPAKTPACKHASLGYWEKRVHGKDHVLMVHGAGGRGEAGEERIKRVSSEVKQGRRSHKY